MDPMISAAASAIEDLNERLHDYRTAVRRVYESVGGDALAEWKDREAET